LFSSFCSVMSCCRHHCLAYNVVLMSLLWVPDVPYVIVAVNNLFQPSGACESCHNFRSHAIYRQQYQYNSMLKVPVMLWFPFLLLLNNCTFLIYNVYLAWLRPTYSADSRNLPSTSTCKVSCSYAAKETYVVAATTAQCYPVMLFLC